MVYLVVYQDLKQVAGKTMQVMDHALIETTARHLLCMTGVALSQPPMLLNETCYYVLSIEIRYRCRRAMRQPLIALCQIH